METTGHMISGFGDTGNKALRDRYSGLTNLSHGVQRFDHPLNSLSAVSGCYLSTSGPTQLSLFGKFKKWMRGDDSGTLDNSIELDYNKWLVNERRIEGF